MNDVEPHLRDQMNGLDEALAQTSIKFDGLGPRIDSFTKGLEEAEGI